MLYYTLVHLDKIFPPSTLHTYNHHISMEQGGALGNFPSCKYFPLKLLILYLVLLKGCLTWRSMPAFKLGSANGKLNLAIK